MVIIQKIVVGGHWKGRFFFLQTLHTWGPRDCVWSNLEIEREQERERHTQRQRNTEIEIATEIEIERES